MLKVRVIPIVLIDGFAVLKTINFDIRRNLGSPITVARTYNTRFVDELILLDIDASKYNQPIDHFTIKEIASESFMPLTAGGGIKSLNDIQKTLNAGADKVTLNTAALENPDFISKSSNRFGKQCIVVSIDIKDNNIFSHSKRNINFSNVIDYCKTVENLGAGEILINSVDLDGMMTGPDLELIKQISARINIPLIYAGGISSPGDCVEVIKSGASAIAAASIFHFTNYTPNDCKIALRDAGYPVRIDY